jgi:filamentous hemagglutinin
VANAVTATGNDLLLSALGGSLAVNAAVTAGRHASLLASAGITQAAAGDVSAGGTLDVAAGGDITMDAAAVSSTTVNGNIVYNAGGSALIGRLGAGTGKVSIIAVGDILDAQNDRVDAPDTGPGFALLSGDARTVNVTAAELRLETQGAVGAAGNPFDTAVAMLAVNADGGAYVLNDGPLTLGAVGPVLATRVAFDAGNGVVGNGLGLDALFASSGVAKFETRNGSLTLAAPLAAGNDVLLAAGGAGSNVVINSALNLTGTGSLTVLAQGSIEQAAVAITLNGTAGDAPTRNSLFMRAVDGGISQVDGGVAGTPGNVWLLARETITLGSVGGAAVRVESLGQSVQSAGSSAIDVIASNGAALIAGSGAIGTAVNPLRIDVDVVAMEALAIHVTNEGDLDIGAIAQFDVAQVMLNSTRVNREAGDLTGISAVEALSLSADGSLTVNAAVSVDDDLRLSALSGGRLIINADVSVGGNNHLSLLGDAGVAQAAGVRVGSGGTLDVESASGSITMGDGAQASAGGDIRYAALEDVQLGRLETSANVGIFATNGAILGGGGPGTNIRADQLQLVAGNGIGSAASAIVTEVSRFAARAGAEGINISNTGALLIGPATGVRVNRVADDGLSALIIAPDLADVVTTGGGRIQLATSAGMTLAASVNSGSGVTTLIAGADGVQGNAGRVLAAQGRVLSGGAVSLGGDNRLGSFAADIRRGGLSLNNLGTLTIGQVEGTAGVLTRGGPITLSANGGDLRLQRSVSTGSSASGVVNLRATGSVLRTSGAGFVRGSQLAAVAGGDVFLTAPTNPVSTPAGVLFNGGANDVLTVAGRAGRNFVFAGGGNLRVGSVAGTSGVTGGFVWVRSGGDLDLSNAITVSGARGLQTGHGAVLVAEGLFRNTTGLGQGAIRDNGAGWLVYDGGSLRELSRFAGLTSDFVVFNQRYDQLPANLLTRGGRGLVTAGALLGAGAVLGGEFGAAPTDLLTAVGAQTQSGALPKPSWAFGPQAVPLTETRIFTPAEPFLGVQDGLAGLGSAPVVALGQESGRAIQAGVSLRVEPGLRFRSGLGGLLGPDGQLRGATLADGAPLPDWMDVVVRADGPVLVGQVPVDFVGPLVLRLEVEGDDPGAVEVIDLEVVGGERMQLITRAAL